MQSSGFLLLRVRAWEPPSHILQFPFRLTTFHMLMSFNHKMWPYCVHLKNIPFKTKVFKSFNYMCLPHIISLCYYHAVVCEVKLLSCVLLFAIPWTVAYQAPPSMGFSRREYWSGLPFPSPGDLPDPGIKPGSPALQADALTEICLFSNHYSKIFLVLNYVSATLSQIHGFLIRKTWFLLDIYFNYFLL